MAVRSTVLACLLLFLAAGCGERPGGDPDAGAEPDAGPPYDPTVGNPFDGPLDLNDERTAAVEPGALPATPSPCRVPILARVTRDIDGDTVFVAGISESLSDRVRLIGVDTPELAHDGEPAECWSAEATEFTEQLVGRTVWLTFDQECVDDFGRLLAYVWIGEGPQDLWQRQLLRRGHATLLSIWPNVAYEDVLSQDEFVARRDGEGLWGECR